ncbi:unnamed protein product, partial [marine sediment metagenome]
MSKDKQLIARVVLVLRNNLAPIVEELNTILKQLGPSEFKAAKTQEKKPAAATDSRIPQLDLAELDDAEWISYATKARAKPGDAAWLKNPEYFQNVSAPPIITELLAALKRSSTKRL